MQIHPTGNCHRASSFAISARLVINAQTVPHPIVIKSLRSSITMGVMWFSIFGYYNQYRQNKNILHVDKFWYSRHLCLVVISYKMHTSLSLYYIRLEDSIGHILSNVQSLVSRHKKGMVLTFDLYRIYVNSYSLYSITIG